MHSRHSLTCRSRFSARLCIEALEERFAPARYSSGQLAIQPQTYAADSILVRTSTSSLSLPSQYAKAVSQVIRISSGIYEVSLKPQIGVASALTMLRQVPGVVQVEPNYRIQVAITPDDPLFPSQWALSNSQNPGADIHAQAAWNISTNASTVTVAVIDTGIEYNHPDLAANIWQNPGEIPENGRDDDGNGYIDDVYGYDFANNDSNPMDDHGHGTHVAGIIGAVGNNHTGIAGVAWNVKLMALKFLDASGTGTIADAVRAIDYAIRNGARIINASWGGPGFSTILASAISRAESAGVLFVTAAGNSATNNDQTPNYPASFQNSNILAVAATNSYDTLASFSNYGPTTVHLAAPGVSILSTLPGNRYGAWSGTSMAAPHVSGAAALLWAMHPDWTFRQVKQRLLQTVDPLTSLQGKVISGGRLNLERALQSLPHQDTIGPRVLQLSWNISNNALTGARVTFSETIATLPADAVTLLGPANQRVRLISIRRLNNDPPGSSFNLVFATQTAPGTYSLQIGPNVTDLAGNWMDQNGDGITGDPYQDRFIAQTSLTPSYMYRTGILNAPIRDYTTTVTYLTVPQHIRVAELQVQINIEHTWTSDLVIKLTSPGRQTVTLAYRRGGSGHNYSATIFSDNADVPIASGLAPFRGTYRPEQLLAAFRNQDAYGTWTLLVQDLARADTGRVVNWALLIDGTPIASNRTRRLLGHSASMRSAPAQFNFVAAVGQIVDYSIPTLASSYGENRADTIPGPALPRLGLSQPSPPRELHLSLPQLQHPNATQSEPYTLPHGAFNSQLSFPSEFRFTDQELDIINALDWSGRLSFRLGSLLATRRDATEIVEELDLEVANRTD